MGKNKQNKQKKQICTTNMPTVSICTPTYNRRKFIPFIIKCYLAQTYPKSLIEWIVVDDGSDKVEDLFKDVPGVKYFYQEEKMKLGKKRNYMHSKATGDIIIYMDDDDYYPPSRVRHAVIKLRSKKNIWISGCSQVYIYFKDLDKIYSFGPYGPYHSTAGTFAFKRELLKNTQYDDDSEMAEEKHFLKNYTIPLVQLDPMKSILVFAHDMNTFDKRKLLINANPNIVKETNLKLKKIIKDKEMLHFYMTQ